MNEGAPLRLTIDRGALTRNWRTLAAIAAPAECAAVVKADAYGIGIDIAVPPLVAAGCRTFFVAQPAEGARVRKVAPDAAVYVLNGLVGDPGYYLKHDLRPVLCDLAGIEAWAAFRSANTGAPNAAIQIDTGMNRLGLTMDEGRSLEPALVAAAGTDLLMSHLACADEPDHPLNGAQRERFAELRRALPPLPGSLANSAGIFLGPDFHHDLVRPGIAVYGGRSHPAANQEPTVTMEARILQVRKARAGETVGYGATQTLGRDSRIAVLSAGYADGYLRAAGAGGDRPRAEVAIDGRRAPLVGRVSMDLIAVDVTDLPESAVNSGRRAELFGPTIPLDEVADRAGTIGYELLTRLSRRAERRVVG